MASEIKSRTRTSRRAAEPPPQGRLAGRDGQREARERFVFSLTPDEMAAMITLKERTLLRLIHLIRCD